MFGVVGGDVLGWKGSFGTIAETEKYDGRQINRKWPKTGRKTFGQIHRKRKLKKVCKRKHR